MSTAHSFKKDLTYYLFLTHSFVAFTPVMFVSLSLTVMIGVGSPPLNLTVHEISFVMPTFIVEDAVHDVASSG